MKKQLDTLLKANPKAKKNERIIRDALRDVRKLRQSGLTGEGYNLVEPFGEKHTLNPSEGVIDRRRPVFST